MICPHYSSYELENLTSFGKFEFVRCGGCGLLTTSPMPSFTVIPDYYADKVTGGNYSRFNPESEQQRQGIFKSYLKSFQKVTGSSIHGNVVLDVGFFNGFYRSGIKKCGGMPFGVELQRQAALEAA
jgi:hypothetical protein